MSLKKLWPSNHPLCGHFRWYKYLNCRPWRTEYIFVTPLHNKRRATVSRDNHWTRNWCQQPRTSTRNDVIPSVDASKVYFVALLLTQYWLACKLTSTKRNFDTHQSVTDITAAIGTPCLHKLWLGLVLTTGSSSITTFALTWTGDCVCGHLLSSNETLALSYGHMGGMRLWTNFATESRVVTWISGDHTVSKDTYCVANNL